MKRKFLEDMGLEKEQVDKILDENSQDIGKAKGDSEKIQKDLDAANAEVESLKGQISDRDKQLKIDAAIDSALTGAKAKNNTAVKALLKDLDKAELGDDGTIKGLAEQIEALQKSDAYLFDTTTKKKTQVKGAKPGESGNDDGDHEVDTSKMTYSELAAYMAEHPDAEI